MLENILQNSYLTEEVDVNAVTANLYEGVLEVRVSKKHPNKNEKSTKINNHLSSFSGCINHFFVNGCRF